MFSLVLPTYNEAENIALCIERVMKVLNDGRDFEIIVADDNSPDLTWKVAEDLKNPRVRVLRRFTNPGLSPAVVEAFSIAKGDTLGVMDADLQHDEEILPQLIDALKNFEFAIGTRTGMGGSFGEFAWYRKLTSTLAIILSRTILGVRLSDPMAGFFTLRRSVFERALPHLKPKGYKIMLEIFCVARPKPYKEIGFRFRTRQFGQSKLGLKVMVQYLISLFDLRRKLRSY